VLRGRLKAAVRMSFYDKAAGWLDQELAREREAAATWLFSRLGELMREPIATRRSVKSGFGHAVRETREHRQSSVRPF
jgi:hypothetical protein